MARWTPRWTGEDLEGQLPGPDPTSPLIPNVDEHNEFAREAARYLVVLGLLAECEPSPLRIELDKKERTTRHVYSDRPEVPKPREPTPIEARVADDIEVSGHLKRQRYGEAGRSGDGSTSRATRREGGMGRGGK